MTGSGETYTLPNTSVVYDVDNLWGCIIKNLSGGDVTIDAGTGDTIETITGGVTSFELADGEAVKIFAGADNSMEVV